MRGGKTNCCSSPRWLHGAGGSCSLAASISASGVKRKMLPSGRHGVSAPESPRAVWAPSTHTGWNGLRCECVHIHVCAYVCVCVCVRLNECLHRAMVY